MLNFWKRRWFRTLPNYYLCLGVCVGVLFVLGKGGIFDGKWFVVGQHIVFLQNLFYGREEWFYGVSWSLAVEEWFYLLSPLVILLFVKLFGHVSVKYASILGIIVLLAVPTLARWVHYPSLEMWGGDLRAVVVYRLDSIAYGMLGSWLLRYTKAFELYPRISFVLGVGFLIFAHIWVCSGLGHLSLPDRSLFSGVFIFSMTSSGALLLLPMLRNIRTVGTSFLDGLVFHTSIWSYSMYLYHGFCITLVSLVGRRFLGNDSNSIFVALMYVVSVFVLSYLLSWFVYAFFESKMTSLLRDRFSHSEKKFV